MKPYHIHCIERIQAQLYGLKKTSRLMLSSKIIFFLSFLAFGYRYLANSHASNGLLAVSFFIIYLISYIYDSMLMKKIGHLKHLQQSHENELKGLNDDFSAFDCGEEYVNADHEYSFDLDIFGKNSFFNRICRTTTGVGKKRLAEILQNISTDRQEIEERQNAVKELSQKNEWCVRFFSHASIKSRIREILPLMDSDSSSLQTRFTHLRFVFKCGLPLIAFWGTFIASLIGTLPTAIPLMLCFFNLIYVGFYARTRKKLFVEVNQLRKEFLGYSKLLQEIQKEPFDSRRLRQAKGLLFGDRQHNADEAFKQASRILNTVELRDNAIMFLVLEGFFLADLWMIRLLLRWKATYLHQISRWVDALSDIDAFVSLGNYTFNHPENHYPQILENSDIAIAATGIYHPFLHPGKAVPNDIMEKKGEMFIVTGANMAGKSTLLRTIGINMIMANAGLPVCAKECRFSLMKLFSNMRTTDNLSRNISYFHAELLRLKQLIGYCKTNAHTFLILDEIMKGTNSEDKLRGSRLFLTYIIQLPITGIVATHDLELSKIETEGQPFKNFCFEIEMSEQIRYSYKMSRGVAHNMNATYLLHKILEDAEK